MAVKATRVKGTAMLNQPNAKKSLGKRISTEVKRHWQLYVMLILPVTYLIIFAYLLWAGGYLRLGPFYPRVESGERLGRIKTLQKFLYPHRISGFDEKYACTQFVQPCNQLSHAYPPCVGN